MTSRFRFSPLFILGWILVLTGCGADSSEEKMAATHKTGARVVTLTKKNMRETGFELSRVTSEPLTGTLAASARVVPDQDLEAHVGSLVQGRVHEVFVRVGDYVTTDRVLMTVEGLDVGAIKAGFLKARATHDYLKANYERQKKLFSDNVGSQKALLESQAEYEKALAEYAAEDKRIHSIGLDDVDVAMGKKGEEHTAGTLPIKSRINGVVVERNVIVGQFVDATTNAFKVIDTKTVWVDGQIYEKDLAIVEQKTRAVFTTATFPNREFRGRIISIGQVVDEQSRTITIRGEFSNPDRKLKPNMFGELKIPVGSNAKAILLPEEAIVTESGQHYAFVQTNDTTFEKRAVHVGSSINNKIEIRDGLKEGEYVASKGVFYLKSELKKEEIAGEEH